MWRRNAKRKGPRVRAAAAINQAAEVSPRRLSVALRDRGVTAEPGHGATAQRLTIPEIYEREWGVSWRLFCRSQVGPIDMTLMRSNDAESMRFRCLSGR